jgi:hypothetical protein
MGTPDYRKSVIFLSVTEEAINPKVLVTKKELKIQWHWDTGGEQPEDWA